VGIERGRELLERVAEQRARRAVEDDEQTDEHDHRGQLAGVRQPADLAQQQALDREPDDEREHQRDDERDPVRDAGLGQRERDVGREHRHLALREVHLVGRLEDHHQRERDAGVDRAVGDSGQQLVKERLHGHCPR
jgi:hypothetical protein